VFATGEKRASFHDAVKRSIEVAWVAFCAYWFIMAFSVKRAVKRQSLSSRGLHIAVGVLAYMLLFTDRVSWGPLAWRFIPDSPAWAVAAR
jgi:hypothetical protein